jgi:serine/threonine protein kinase
MLFAGEEYYLAPEVAEKHGAYTQESDRWGLGMFLRELTCLETAELA